MESTIFRLRKSGNTSSFSWPPFVLTLCARIWIWSRSSNMWIRLVLAAHYRRKPFRLIHLIARISGLSGWLHFYFPVILPALNFGKRLLEDGEQPINIISLVLYQLRICYKAKLFSDENYKALIGVQGFQLFKDFNRYTAATYKKLINLFVSGINRIKKGEKGYAVLTDCLTASGIILKEDF